MDALLTKAFSITDDQWAVKGLRSPFWFGLPYVQLTAMFKTSDGAAAIASAQLDNPFLAYVVDLKFFSETVIKH